MDSVLPLLFPANASFLRKHGVKGSVEAAKAGSVKKSQPVSASHFEAHSATADVLSTPAFATKSPVTSKFGMQ